MVENLERSSNYGMMIRMAEALGVNEIIFCTTLYKELTPKMKRSSRSAENHMKVRFSEDINQEIASFRKNQYEIIGLEYTSRSKNIKEINFSHQPKVLICGSESFGLSEPTIMHCDHCVHLPMYGKNSSMNVVMAASIALWEMIGSDE